MAQPTIRNSTPEAYGNAARELAPAFESARDACFFVYFDLQVGFLNAAARRDIESRGGNVGAYIGARLWDVLGYSEENPGRIAVEWAISMRKPVSFCLRGSATDSHWVENDVVPMPSGVLIWYREPQRMQTPGETDVIAGVKVGPAYHMVQRLAGGIAHDFNNLVTAIKGAAAELYEPDLEREQVLECARDIEQAANRAASLTAQLLAFSRRQVLRPTMFDLGAHLRSIEPALSIGLDGIGKLKVDIDHGLGNVHADSQQIEKALLNLVVNARDAVRGRGDGCVTIRGRNVDLESEFGEWHVIGTPGPYVRIDIEDNGPGIDIAAREHLFEPFYTTKGLGVAGLGLATAYGIVKQSGGYIWARNLDRGGSIFSVYLPRAVPTSVATPTVRAQAPAPTAQPAGNERILLVEDEDAIRRVARRSLELEGYRITEAADGAAALQLAEQGEFDLLLTDVMMPKMLGTTLVEHLKNRRPLLPVLLMSGHSDELLREGLIDSTTPFLAKPFTPPQLAEKVRETLASHRATAIAS